MCRALKEFLIFLQKLKLLILLIFYGGSELGFQAFLVFDMQYDP